MTGDDFHLTPGMKYYGNRNITSESVVVMQIKKHELKLPSM